ncbi:MAG: hypothetical protein IJJ86_03900 [Clostridia bacterium]|nr:hypothetical protein [Clostridia bacterium]
MPYEVKLVLALLLTEAIEIPVCLLFGMRGKELLIVLLANVITNPLVNALLLLGTAVTNLPYAVMLAALEVAAVVAEWLVYRSLTEAKRPFLISLAANAASFGAGLIIMKIIP